MLFMRSLPLRAPAAFQSKFGPKLKTQAHIGGFPLVAFKNYAFTAAGFGAAAGIALIFFAEEVPPVRRDILEQIPVIGGYWKREIAPEDNPF
ncbi:hypothetical protein BT63DRAFT_482756 [Microthyrium microscopicum]|uniref:Uncharacterized protein n=1 Tax=Microthyrium microscopicum TaxID=703497 RepID=A0A6A6TXN8_9PEZI|nr:hypothetical protein BT63DRAFT_482756 [Microthyrium microscopicum]